MNNTGQKFGGRSKGTPNKSTADIKAILAERVDFGLVIDKLFELTQGIEVQAINTQGESYIYSKAADPKAAQILLEYGFGKPQAHLDITSLGEELTTLHVEIIGKKDEGK